MSNKDFRKTFFCFFVVLIIGMACKGLTFLNLLLSLVGAILMVASCIGIIILHVLWHEYTKNHSKSLTVSIINVVIWLAILIMGMHLKVRDIGIVAAILLCYHISAMFYFSCRVLVDYMDNIEGNQEKYKNQGVYSIDKHKKR